VYDVLDHFGGFFFVKAFEAGFVWKKRRGERGKRKSRENDTQRIRIES
jgi:hypothetical protein